jgi:glycosyltransferase involved in cell wall biosynthesis
MYKAKIDLHCHSSASCNPGLWLLRQIGCSESYTSPNNVYKIATDRAMDFVTITDHNSIDGVKEIAHYNNVLISEEVTAYFPDRVTTHIVCLDITEQQHKEINEARHNIYDLVYYLTNEDIVHFVAHPLFKANGDLTWEHFEKLILLFKRHEVLNGGRYSRTNQATEKFLSSLTREYIETLANKHDIMPIGDEPHKKFLVGGSDDHGGLFIGSCYTEVNIKEMTKQGLMEGIRKGQTKPVGENFGSLTLAHQIGSVANQYYLSKHGDESQEAVILNRLFNRAKIHSKKKKKAKKSGSAWLKKISKSLDRDSYKNSFNLIDEVRLIIREKPDIGKLFQKKPLEDKEFNELFFCLSSELLDRLLIQAIKRPNLLGPSMIWGSIILTAYLTSMSSICSDIELIRKAESLIGIEKPKKVAWFTDRYEGTDGVVVTVKKFLGASAEYNSDLTIVISDDTMENHPKGIKSFRSISQFKLPAYDHITVNVPSLLKIARWMEEEQFDSIVISTPGPVGLAGMISAKVLGLPITAIYHTDYPRFSRELTGDQTFANIVTKLTKVFYDQANHILVPSNAYADDLVSIGINRDKIGFLKRWVDRQLFTPAKRNGYFKDNGDLRLLYVGRISKEKNVDLLLKVHSELSARNKDFTIYCVGDGPYLKELKHKTADLGKFELLGPLFGEELAEAYASADLFVFPSLTDTFGNVVLEAQASGLPCVVMDQGGPKEIIVDGKSGIVANDENTFISAIEKLMSDSNLRDQMSKSAVINSGQFDKHQIYTNFWQNL